MAGSDESMIGKTCLATAATTGNGDPSRHPTDCLSLVLEE
jgi:hypothetical protein